MTESDEENWCAAQRLQVAEYLQREGVIHGEIGDWPAWHIAPYVSVWAIESVKAAGSVGWWALCGDLPTDYCSAEDCRHPRLAMQKIAEEWHDAVQTSKPGDATLGDTSLPISLAPLLEKRAELLLRWVRDDSVWPD